MAKGIKTGGRKPGSLNKATADVRALCVAYTAEAVRELYRLATKAASEQARVAAIKELLDRGFGRPAQSISVGQDEDLGPLLITWAGK